LVTEQRTQRHFTFSEAFLLHGAAVLVLPGGVSRKQEKKKEVGLCPAL
jgi:hypothetical protein